MSLLDVALACIARGWYVFPASQVGKHPIHGLAPDGLNSATNDPEKVRRWWTVKPNANVGINCGMSGLIVVDCDGGNNAEHDFWRWASVEGVRETYTVRTGRRPEFGTHCYYQGEPRTTRRWERNGHKGEFRSIGAYVLAAGSIHPVSGEAYSVLVDAPIATFPDELARWVEPEKEFTAEGAGTLDDLRVALEEHGIDYEDRGDKLYVKCPWSAGHSSFSGVSESALFVRNGLYCFKCQHSSCDGRGYSMYATEVEKGLQSL
jgi:hypothetical protein